MTTKRKTARRKTLVGPRASSAGGHELATTHDAATRREQAFAHLDELDQENADLSVKIDAAEIGPAGASEQARAWPAGANEQVWAWWARRNEVQAERRALVAALERIGRATRQENDERPYRASPEDISAAAAELATGRIDEARAERIVGTAAVLPSQQPPYMAAGLVLEWLREDSRKNLSRDWEGRTVHLTSEEARRLTHGIEVGITSPGERSVQRSGPVAARLLRTREREAELTEAVYAALQDTPVERLDNVAGVTPSHKARAAAIARSSALASCLKPGLFSDKAETARFAQAVSRNLGQTLTPGKREVRAAVLLAMKEK